MNVAVCIKQVPNTNRVKIDKKTGTLIRKGIANIFNPDDKNALEEALKLKDSYYDVKITVLSMGPSQAAIVLKEALAMGADRGILLSDRKFAGSDTLATSTILAAALRKIGEQEKKNKKNGLDIIFCGWQAIDGDTAQVGPQIAQHLKLPIVSAVQEFKYLGNKIRAKRAFEKGYLEIESQVPVVITTVKELNTPRYPHMSRIFDVFGDNPLITIETWTADDLSELDQTKIGLKGSPTSVVRTFTPDRTFHGEILNGEPNDIAKLLAERLKQKQII
ncbi:MAG: electron transfer flavoprotein subunit beta [Promethearchaeota archaeon]